MNKVFIIILVVVIALIIRQLIPKKVDSFDLLGIPIMAIIRTYMDLPNRLDFIITIELISLLIFGAIVGYWQAKRVKVFYHNNQLCSVGGYTYIIGWAIMLLGRIVILLLFNLNSLISKFHAGQEQFTSEIIQVLAHAGDWLIWSTILASSIMYTVTLYKDHSDIKKLIHARFKEIKQRIKY
ncbi:hypothetical protein ACW4EZ_17030 [Bacillus toyonensis]|uniref:hypothetical protein n=1 Tax=Bacillus toyonensis TaxID=155322 RepID=UPI000BF2085F|nr:hypothetical protein [Bacillus toyonensis]MDF9450578.1 hypothetical protein [Bacillus toyonensis]MDG1564668.1 hypothetical protein [Bacillus toyonensis]PEO67063.1 hypothetical protein CN567_07090 [Bacillus toyonensis]PFX82243.1 hypothetical protein COL38_09805 [Bacillus toyonensis]PFX87905.1 hypothetical protein COL37_15790 [Bacillus toyonensis]